MFSFFLSCLYRCCYRKMVEEKVHHAKSKVAEMADSGNGVMFETGKGAE
jgi:hypothetical protein